CCPVHNILGFDMLYSLSEMVFSTSGWIMKTNIVSASSLIIPDETEFRPIISCQNVWGVARLGKWILWGPRTKSLITTALEDCTEQESSKSRLKKTDQIMPSCCGPPGDGQEQGETMNHHSH